eukprot:COSAG02_NODE_58629_length_276_cov_2.587571_2_plen_62_part_01
MVAVGHSSRVYGFCAAENYWPHTQAGGVIALVFLNKANAVTELRASRSVTGVFADLLSRRTD